MPTRDATVERSPSNGEGGSPPGPAEEPRHRSDEPSRQVVFEVLDNQRRRSVVHYLLQREGPVELRDLSTRVAAWENQVPVDEVTPRQRHRVYNALQQVHLPKMDRAGVVDYDRDRGRITPTDGLADLQVYLEVVPGDDIPWSTYYLLLGVLGSVVTLAVWFDVVPAIPDVTAAALLSVLLVVSGAVHTYRRRQVSLGMEGPPPELSEP